MVTQMNITVLGQYCYQYCAITLLPFILKYCWILYILYKLNYGVTIMYILLYCYLSYHIRAFRYILYCFLVHCIKIVNKFVLQCCIVCACNVQCATLRQFCNSPRHSELQHRWRRLRLS